MAHRLPSNETPVFLAKTGIAPEERIDDVVHILGLRVVKQLAVRSGIGQGQISRIERGQKSPTLDTFARLAAALELTLPLPLKRSAA